LKLVFASSSLKKYFPSARLIPRATLIAFSAAALVASPVLWASQLQVAQASDLAIQLTPPSAEFPTPFGEQPEIDSPVGDLRPGQYLEYGDPQLPPSSELDIEGGDEFFGYAPLNDEQTLYLM